MDNPLRPNCFLVISFLGLNFILFLAIYQFVNDGFFAIGWGKFLWNSRIIFFITIPHYKITRPQVSNLCQISLVTFFNFFSTNEYISKYDGVQDYFHWLFNIFSMIIYLFQYSHWFFQEGTFMFNFNLNSY